MESIDLISLKAAKIRKRSKKLLAFTVMTLAASAIAANAKAQTFAEWFQQKSTQKKYLAQQIAALEMYAAYYRVGNNIAHNGLGSITNALIEENGLHANYYNNLSHVNASVKNNTQVKDIVQWQQDILRRMFNIEKSAGLIGGEKKYISNVKSALLNDCDQQIYELQIIVSDSKLKMSDQERLKHIDIIHSAMENNYRFASTFSEQLKGILANRKSESNSLATEKKLLGIQ
ncbi:hypothetical protein [Mucilaginibacter ginkgonis]|uniref:Uncharacterized protein n=1 Tax=Mucilaginibacter ginkgonis TaxID=2682091 RepID=A0A6I4HV84_9SPHI|nr:hypothetical protein [Mucilaginibacter ginkgonis]QQL50158.1 hypothetical protein GO620_001520 [Mucilaginibacter ginkgonis]